MAPVGGRAIFRSEGQADGMTGTIVVRVADEEPTRALLADDAVFLINTPGPGWALGCLWVQWKSQAWQQVTGRKSAPYSLGTITWEESADPDVDLIAAWDFDALTAYLVANGKNFSTAVPAIWSNFDNLSIDTRV